MKISKEKAEALANHLASGFMAAAVTQAKKRLQEALTAAMDGLSRPSLEVVAWLDAVPESAQQFLKDRDYNPRVILSGREGPGYVEYLQLRHILDGAVMADRPRWWMDVTLKDETPHRVLFKRVATAVAANRDVETNKNKLYNELLGNIRGAGTVKKLIEAWPNQKAAIEEFFGTETTGTCQSPLESILEKYSNLALPAPVEGE